MHLRQQVFGVHPECVPGLRPATISFITKAVEDGNIGLSARKDFLENVPEIGQVIHKVIDKVNHTCRLYIWLVLVFHTYYMPT